MTSIVDTANSIVSRGSGTSGPVANRFDLAAAATFFDEGTYARADAATCATRIDSTGQLQLYTANTGLYDYTFGRKAYLSEESRKNYCTNFNALPTATTGLSVTGTATVSAVADATALSAAKLANVVTGNVIQASGGASGGTVVIAGATGATGTYAASVYARDVTSTGASFGITPSPTATAIAGPAYTRYKAERLASTATSDTMVITIPAGVTINFILNQLELGNRCTSVIKIDGATRTRAKTSWIRSDIATKSYWNPTNGGVVLEISPQEDQDNAIQQYLLHAGSTGSFPTDGYVININATSGKYASTLRSNNSSSFATSPNTGLMIGKIIPVCTVWKNGSSMTNVVGPASYTTTTITAVPQLAIVQLAIGNSMSLGGQFNGWIFSISFLNGVTTIAQAAQHMLGASVGYTEHGVILSGQSNAENLGNGTTPNFYNAGEKAFRAMADSILGTTSRNWLINGATGGTSYTAWQPGGSALAKWQGVVDAYCGAGGIIDAIWWDQGEADVGNSTAIMQAAWQGIFDYLRSYIQGKQGGIAPDVFLMPLGKYHFPSTYNDTTNNGAIAMRLAQRNLASVNTYVHLGMEKFHQPLVDAIVHLTPAGYISHANNGCRLIYKQLGFTVSEGVMGPSITGAVRTGASIAITTAQDSGTDFSTHTLTVDGWRFFQNGNSATPITISSVTYNSATSLTVTLASDPGAGSHTLLYGDDLLWGDVQANLIRDNSTYALALRQFTATV